MGKDRDPWQLRSFDCANNVGPPPALAKPSTNSMKFPNYADPYGLYNLNSTTVMPRAHPTGFNCGQKTFIVFDQSGDQSSLIFRSLGTQLPYPNTADFGFRLGIPASNACLGLDLQASNETDASANEEMHEDTEEIDALLYSDSENDYDDEEEASTGHSPISTATGSFVGEEEEVASSAVLEPLPTPPAKRRRIEPESELDPSLADTASSTNNADRKKAMRERIQETVGVLRRIIPGGTGKKDAAAVLEEAIQYLKSLRLKAKGLGAPSLK